MSLAFGFARFCWGSDAQNRNSARAGEEEKLDGIEKTRSRASEGDSTANGA